MTIFASYSFLFPGNNFAGLGYSDQNQLSFEHRNRDFLDLYMLSGDPLSGGYNTGRKIGRLLFDLGDGGGGLLTQINRCIKYTYPVDTNDYEAEMHLWIDPSVMHAEGVIALRAKNGSGYDTVFAGMQYVIGSGGVDVNFAESDGDGVANSVPLGFVAKTGMRKIKLVARIETVGADVQVTCFVDGTQVGAPQVVGELFPIALGDMEASGEVYFVIQPTNDGTVPVGSPAGIGPFSKIEASYFAVGSLDALSLPHKEGSVLPPNYDWYDIEDEKFYPLLLPLPMGYGLPDGTGVMPDPDPTEEGDTDSGYLPPLIGSNVILEHVIDGTNDWSAHITLPQLRVRMNIGVSGLWRFNVILPKPYTLLYFGAHFRFALPMLAVTMGMTIANVLRIHAVLPRLTAVEDEFPGVADPIWQGSVGHVWQFRITLPEIHTAGRMGGWQFRIKLPKLKATASGAGASAGSGLRFHIRLPHCIKVHMHITTAPAGLRARVVLPMLAMSKSLSGAVLLPALRASARLSWAETGVGAPARRGWAMNLQNSAVTEFRGFEFRAMAFAYNRHFGVGFDGGLYEMGGDKDVDRPIAWQWDSGLTDLGVNGQKGLLALYVDGLFEKSATFAVESDNARRVYGHKFRGDPLNHQPHRVTLGKGVRTRNVSIGMADEEGGYLELDKVTPEYIVTKRNL